MQYLYSKGTFLTGTVRKTRKGLPNQVKQKFQVGEKVYCQNDKTVVLAYREKLSKKTVSIVSFKPEVGEIDVTVKRRGRETTKSKPALIQSYNTYMGGIDNFDMMLYQYLDLYQYLFAVPSNIGKRWHSISLHEWFSTRMLFIKIHVVI